MVLDESVYCFERRWVRTLLWDAVCKESVAARDWAGPLETVPKIRIEIYMR